MTCWKTRTWDRASKKRQGHIKGLHELMSRGPCSGGKARKSPRGRARQAGLCAVRAYVALGSNLGDRKQNMNAAIEKMKHVRGLRVTKVSSFLETEPVGGPPQGKYLNAVVEIECSLSAHELLRELQRIENELGRTRLGKSFPRTMDLDILLFGDAIVDEVELKIPHPRMHQRAFVLDPLHEIAPDAVHPLLGLPVSELKRTQGKRQAGT